MHMAPHMPLPLTASYFSKIQIGFKILVPAQPDSPGQRAVKRVCVCVYRARKKPVCSMSNPVLYWGVYAGIRRIPTSGFF